MVFMPFFPPPGQIPRSPQQYFQEDVIFPDTTENSFNGRRGAREAAHPRGTWNPPRRTWKGRFQRALARVSKFFRRGRRSARG